MTPNAMWEWFVHNAFPIVTTVGTLIILIYLWYRFVLWRKRKVKD